MKPEDWNNIANEYVSITKESRYLIVFPFVIGLLERIRPQKVLDFGCGDGAFAVQCAQSLHDVSIDVTDSAQSMLTRLQKRIGKEARIKVLPPSQELPLSAYDAVTLNAVWMGWESERECIRILAAIERSLVPGGKLLASITHPCFRDRTFSTFTTDFAVSSYFNEGTPFGVEINDGTHRVRLRNTHWTLGAHANQLHQAGLRISAIHELPDADCAFPGSPWMVIEASKIENYDSD